MGIEQINPTRHPILHAVAQGARWVQEDQYPVSVEWADQAEERLRFIQNRGRLGTYLPRFRASARERDDARAEITAAFFLETRCGYPIVCWEPPGRGQRVGEFLVSLPDSGDIFVEVKRPNWRKEVVDAEGQESPRLSRPKYLDGEGRATAPWKAVRNVVSRAYAQMPDSMPTLLILCDDLFLPLNLTSGSSLDYYNPRRALYGEGGCFVGREYERLGAVGTLNEEVPGEITFAVFHNPNALPTVTLPPSIFPGYFHCDGGDWPRSGAVRKLSENPCRKLPTRTKSVVG